MELKELMKQLSEENLMSGTLSDPKMKSAEYKRTKIQYIEDNKAYYQFERFTKEQAFHENVDKSDLMKVLEEELILYKQGTLITDQSERIIRISKKGKVHATKKVLTTKIEAKSHNKKKQHLLESGKPVDFLVELGIMDSAGNVRHKWFDKFKQINRYLEFIEDSLTALDTSEPTIIDFGCGKSYLTFALYYYLVKVKGYKVKIIGLDLKEKVIQDLNVLVKKLKYDGLEFRVGDIAMFDYEATIDMVISLHACNLATDYALEKAVKWEAKVIMAVPCCHKEVNQQINKEPMIAVMQFGVLKERISALMTDGLRGELLKAAGYDVSVMEFIDMEHTPKNLMIRAYKNGNPLDKPSKMYYDLCREYGLKPTLEKLLFEDNK